ncbi:serine/threonine-protein kinase pim-2-like [Mugil cephalus]|uniref:serine/threonine-protein kinase pim-2-like n=1 Tax=Mugil cephalus TaxID=48193 RepID=UPI001FB6A4D2|nr:serine/threonine-protein kinase pim-2-like [Mugil cephalus]
MLVFLSCRSRLNLFPNSQIVENRKKHVIREVYFMIKAAGGPESSGRSAATSLLDCFDLEDHLILVMERPRNCKTLLDYRRDKEDHLAEDEAKVIMEQMIDAAIDMHSKGVFHRDIKLSNILVEVDPVGCSCQEELEPYDRFSGCTIFLRQCLTPYPHDRITLEELKHHPWIRE